MADLEERLRIAASDKRLDIGTAWNLLEWAADHISAQTAEIERLKERAKESARNYPLVAVKEIAAQTQTISDLTTERERLNASMLHESLESAAAWEKAERRISNLTRALIDIAGPDIPIDARKYDGQDAVAMRQIARTALSSARSVSTEEEK